MDTFDPRELGDRALLVHLLFGDLPRPGWPGRRRAIARRLLEVAVQVVTFVLVLIALLGLIVIVWAASLPAPR